MKNMLENRTKNIKGRRDCKMKNREYTDRYERLIDFMITTKKLYQMIEIDSRKGMRLMEFDFNGIICKERKWPKLINKRFSLIKSNKIMNRDLNEYKLK